MAVISPAAYIQAGSHSAQGDRQVLSALVGQDIETFTNGVTATGPGHGLVGADHLAVSEKSGTPNMSVDVAAGLALITGSSSLAQGVYAFSNDATVNLAIATADATNPRYDLVIAQVRDNTEDSGGNNDAQLAVVTGTPAASPADPAVPANCLVLARVEVDALASSIVDADITMLASTAYTLKTVGALEWTSFTPTWSGLTIGNGSQEAWYRYVGGSLEVVGNVTFGSTTAFTATVSQTVPGGVLFDSAKVSGASPHGQVTWFDTSALDTLVGGVQYLGATQVVFKMWNAAGTYLEAVNFSATVPDAGAGDTGDVLSYKYTVVV